MDFHRDPDHLDAALRNMLTIHHSNRMERLVTRLAAELRNPCTDSWTQPEVVIVQSRGMERYVSMGIADTIGISAHVRFPFPATFVWEAYRATLANLPETSPFDKDALAWRILALFDALEEGEGLAPLRAYLAQAEHEGERFELAARIADVFDQYLVYRPDWIVRWEGGRDDHWQAHLWRRLAAVGVAHRARLHKAFATRLAAARKRPPGIPARISLIGISSLPASYLDVFSQLARYSRVDLYCLDPCREYWGMIQAEQAIARFCGEDETTAAELYLETGNRLLASLGRQGRDLQHLVTELDAAPDEDFEDPREDTLLHCLQSDVLHLRNRGSNSSSCDFDHYTTDIPATPLDPRDRSVQVHICHSPLREVEVLYDRLLALFAERAGLKASQVVVMMPDVDAYAAAIRAVFSTAEPRIPYAIADRSLALESPVVDAFLRLLALPDSRFDVNEVLAFLEVAAVRQRFEMAAVELGMIGRWLREMRVRWGVDGARRAALGLPETAEHTWKAGLERLLLGYALPTREQRMYADILPYDPMEGDNARVMGRLQAFCRCLFDVDGRLQRERPVSEWCIELLQLLDDFFTTDDVFEPERNALHDALNALAESAQTAESEQPVGLPVIRAWLRRHLSAGRGSSGFLGSGVTFCAMVPMRSVPFRVICMIGLNDGVFPRPQRPVDFDLMAKRPRRGDRSRRLDDRYLFLEAMLAAREVLYLSYVGRSVRDNAVLPPSPLLSELLDYVRQGFYAQTSEDGNPLRQVVIEHPLQAFSPRYFSHRGPLFSYSSRLCEAARHVGMGEDGGRAFLEAPLPDPDPTYRELNFQQLIGFFQNPARYFLRERLRLQLSEQEGLLETREPFELETFADQAIRERLLQRQLEGSRPGEIIALVRAAGLLPHGSMGDVLYAREVHKIKPLLEALKATPRRPGAKIEVDLPLGAFRLSGWLPNVTAEGLMDYSVQALGPRHYLELWIRHLLLNSLKPADVARTSTWLGLGDRVVLEPVDEPDALLQSLLALYWQGMRMPLKFFPRSAWTYLQVEREGKTDPLARARQCWEGSEHSWGEGSNSYYQLAFRHQQPIDASFVALARAVFEPLLEHCVDNG